MCVRSRKRRASKTPSRSASGKADSASDSGSTASAQRPPSAAQRSRGRVASLLYAGPVWTGGEDHCVYQLDPTTAAPVRRMPGHTSWVRDLVAVTMPAELASTATTQRASGSARQGHPGHTRSKSRGKKAQTSRGGGERGRKGGVTADYWPSNVVLWSCSDDGIRVWDNSGTCSTRLSHGTPHRQCRTCLTEFAVRDN